MNVASDPRCPNFFILGAAKAGTTTLYDVLRDHPDVFLTDVKEPQFFSNDGLYARGIEHYLDYHFSGSDAFAARGEATPHYLACEKVAERIASHVDRDACRFIVVLRDPTRRAWSLYWNLVSEGVEPLAFDEALQRENERIADPGLKADGSLRYAYVTSGEYGRQLAHWYRHFERGQFHVVWFDDLVSDPDEVFRGVCRFLGVAQMERLETGSKSNASHRPRSAWLHRFVRRPNPIKALIKPLVPEKLRYRLTSGLIEMNRKSVRNPALDEATERALRERFDSDIGRLEELTGRDLSAWRALVDKVAL